MQGGNKCQNAKEHLLLIRQSAQTQGKQWALVGIFSCSFGFVLPHYLHEIQKQHAVND